MHKAIPCFLALLVGCGGLSPLNADPAGADDTGSSEVTVGGLTASPASIDFGAVGIGASASEQIMLKNDGDATLTIKEPLVTGDYGFEVDTTSLTFPMSLETGGTQVLSVTFAPVEEADLSGQVILRLEGVDSTATVALTGSGSYDVGGDDGGTDDGGSDGGSDEFNVSPTSIDFGVVDIGDTSAETVYVTNNTSDDILITDITSSDDVILVSGQISPPQVLSAGAEKYITVAYAPDAEVVTKATVSITTDSEEAPKTDIQVTGEGYQGCIICSGVITVDTGSGDDHSAALSDLGCSASATLTIQNQGDEDLALKDMDYTNDSFSTCGNFSANWGGPDTLAPWETATIDLSYTASEFCIELAYPTFDQNMLHIYSDDPAEPDYAIELTASVTCLW